MKMKKAQPTKKSKLYRHVMFRHLREISTLIKFAGADYKPYNLALVSARPYINMMYCIIGNLSNAELITENTEIILCKYVDYIYTLVKRSESEKAYILENAINDDIEY